jgi:hypothetical protein
MKTQRTHLENMCSQIFTFGCRTGESFEIPRARVSILRVLLVYLCPSSRHHVIHNRLACHCTVFYVNIMFPIEFGFTTAAGRRTRRRDVIMGSSRTLMIEFYEELALLAL